MSEFVTVAKVGALQEGAGGTYIVGEKLIAVFLHQGKYLAIDDLCPHMGASLGAGHCEDGIVFCPWHAWRFRLNDGAWADNPRIKIGCYETRVVGDEIQVLCEPSDSATPPGLA